MASGDMERAVDALRRVAGSSPPCAIVLGSGLSGLIEQVACPVEVPFSEVPGLPDTTVSGHLGRFVFGTLADAPVVLLAGRLHAYEGHNLNRLVAPIRLLTRLGVDTVLLTNASGGIHPRLAAGDIVLVDDQINLTFGSPLAGPAREGEARFPDMSAPFHVGLQEMVRTVAEKLRIRLCRGTYAGMLGPAYETAAEVRMLASLGADMVGMSTVLEVVAARAAGMRVAALTLVTNRATGLSAEVLSHEDVLAVGAEAGERMIALLSGIAQELRPVTSPEQSD
jgi:purine-nucleoside phosphorylase